MGTRRDLSGDFVANDTQRNLACDFVTRGTQRDLSGDSVTNGYIARLFRGFCYKCVHRKTCQVTLLQVVTQRDLSGEFATNG